MLRRVKCAYRSDAATDADTRRKLAKDVDELMSVVGDVFVSAGHLFKKEPFSVAGEVNILMLARLTIALSIQMKIFFG